VQKSAAQTALGPMVIVAADQYESAPLVHDSWAQRLLPASERMVTTLMRWSPVRRALKGIDALSFWAPVTTRVRTGYPGSLGFRFAKSIFPTATILGSSPCSSRSIILRMFCS
jgi:hypothetical protein